MVNELQSFEPHVNRSYQWIWKVEEEQEEMVHFSAPTYAVDANQTFDVGVLYLYQISLQIFKAYVMLLLYCIAFVVVRWFDSLHGWKCHSSST